ncbi:hypothetical protein PLESTF_000920200 [Pleodorina starrii]|nr:hypothetical protein PLESTF_000920200 [Pleodorina starrii]
MATAVGQGTVLAPQEQPSVAAPASPQEAATAIADSTPVKATSAPVATTQPHDHSDEDSSAFECNICLELAKEPVVTLCGHLFCWPCLYRWMQVQAYSRACPVCKAGVEIDKVVPIYGRGSEPTSKVQEAVKPVPPRPAGQRPAPVPVSIAFGACSVS